MDKPKPCPYCNEQPIVEVFDTAAGGMGHQLCEVVCERCGAFGGTSRTVDGAIAMWDKHATPWQL